MVDASKTMDEMTPEEIDVFLARVYNDCYWVHHLRHQRSHSRAAEEALPGCCIASSTTGAAVELKGFNGKTETTTTGLRWTAYLGNL